MTRFLLLVCSLLMTLCLDAQVITIEVNSNSPLTCASLSIGETLTFVKGSSCGGQVGISTDDGATFTNLFPDDAGVYTYTIPASGNFLIACGVVPDDIATRGGAPAFCIDVVDAVPTLGEWGLISLAFLLMIFSVVAIRNTSKKDVLDVA